MLRALLEDRLKLAVHRESKNVPGYALAVAKSGLKLKPAEPGGAQNTNHHGGRVDTLTAKRAPMSLVADLAARSLGQVVVDRTGLDGVYDFELRWTSQDQDSDGVDAPSLFTAVQEMLDCACSLRKCRAR